MATESLPPITSLPGASEETRHQVLALLFEPSPSLCTKADPILATTEFESYDSLITAVGTELQCLETSTNPKDLESLADILSSHPRLGEKKVDSALSRAEQAAMAKASVSSSDASKEEEQATLRNLNEEYEETFPGLRYVYLIALSVVCSPLTVRRVFVNGRPRPVIFEDMKKRIARGNMRAERLEAIQAMCDIAADRAKKLPIQASL